MLKKALILSATIFSFAFSCCEDHEPSSSICNVDNPSEDLAWLASAIADIEERDRENYFYIASVTYNGETAFLQADCCPTCNTIHVLRACNGDQIGIVGEAME
jgi:hypothetical protein